VPSAFLGLAAQDRQARILVGGVQVDDKSRLDVTQDLLVEMLDFRRRTVAGEDDLLALALQHAHHVDHLLAKARFVDLAAKELDIVKQEDVGVPVDVVEGFEIAFAGDFQVFPREFFGRAVHDLARDVVAEHEVPDGGHEMGLAKSRATDQKERIGAHSTGEFGDLASNGEGEAIAFAFHETLEVHARSQTRGFATNRFGLDFLAGGEGPGDRSAKNRRMERDAGRNIGQSIGIQDDPDLDFAADFFPKDFFDQALVVGVDEFLGDQGGRENLESVAFPLPELERREPCGVSSSADFPSDSLQTRLPEATGIRLNQQ